MAAWGVAIGAFVAWRSGAFSREEPGKADASFSKEEMDAWNSRLQKSAQVQSANARSERS